MVRAGKAWAAALLGLPLSVGIIGVVVLALPGRLETHTLLLLLLLLPTWVGVMSASFLFRTGRQAWRVLGGMTLAVFTLIFLLGKTTWVAWPS